MKSTKKAVVLLAAAAVVMTAFTACGGKKPTPSAPAQSPAPAVQSSAPAVEETSAVEISPDSAAPAVADISLLDLDASMIETGLYSINQDGDEKVFALFNQNGSKCCALIERKGDGSSSSTVCGAYTAMHDRDAEQKVDLTKLTFTDIYSGKECSIGFAEPDDGTCYIFDVDGNYNEASFLSPDDTVNYIASAIYVIQEDANPKSDADTGTGNSVSADNDAYSLVNVDASMINAGLRGTGENGEKILLVLFTKNNTKYCSLSEIETDGSAFITCGAYTAQVEKDEEKNADLTTLTFTDEFSGQSCTVGCTENADGTCFINDMDNHYYGAAYLTADQTVTALNEAVTAVTAS